MIIKKSHVFSGELDKLSKKEEIVNQILELQSKLKIPHPQTRNKMMKTKNEKLKIYLGQLYEKGVNVVTTIEPTDVKQKEISGTSQWLMDMLMLASSGLQNATEQNKDKLGFYIDKDFTKGLVERKEELKTILEEIIRKDYEWLSKYISPYTRLASILLFQLVVNLKFPKQEEPKPPSGSSPPSVS